MKQKVKNEDEKSVEKYLQNLGYTDIEYEPIENETPDFLVNGTIAIEVRRLNLADNQDNGLETTFIPLSRAINQIIDTFDRTIENKYYDITYHCDSRPFPKTKLIKKELPKLLNSICDNPKKLDTQYSIGNVTFCFCPRNPSNKDNKTFVLDGSLDQNEFIWVDNELKEYIQIYSDEKTSKVTKNRHKYKEWWLILVNHIDFRDLEIDKYNIQHTWDKLLIIKPN